MISEELGEFMETKGAHSPGILVLTTGLSRPFMRLDRYPTLLKELERHMEVLLFCGVTWNPSATVTEVIIKDLT